MKHKAMIIAGAAGIALIGGLAGCGKQTSSKTAAQGTAGHEAAAQNTVAQQSGTAQTNGPVAAWSHVVTRDIQDPAYGMTAFTVDVPVGWKFVGTILRPHGCHAPAFPAAGLSYTVLGPDGITAFEQLPGVSWTWTSNGYNMLGPKCPSDMRIDTADAFLLNIVLPNLRPNAKVIAVLSNPQAFRDVLAKNDAQGNAQMRSFGIPGKVINDFGRVRIEYVRNGQPVEEIVAAPIYCQEIQAMMPMQPRHTQRSCRSMATIIIRAPKGHLDALKRIAPPAIDKDWDARVSQDMRTQFEQMQAASDRQFQAIQQHFRQQNDQMLARGRQFNKDLKATTNSAMRADAARQDAIDNSAHQTALHSLDRQTFVNPNTGERIEASSQFNHQWQSSDGSTLIQNQDPSFDPNGVVYPVSQSWTELVPE